ncbi:hypothetical protein [uncultured Serinicoccus sp.]|uniref:hypothetical protein n=1 Tax=uncultured Serinicoccus sp. TaxID=735514 RepID=UPI00261DBFE3|nr:hypothetical protein [uncultured Serinicoccus sp.]
MSGGAGPGARPQEGSDGPTAPTDLAPTDLQATGAPPATGDDEVDATLRTLRRGLDEGDPASVADALATAHRSLQARLTSPDPDQPGSAGARPRPR